ncbi:MAG: AAA family ATPase [Candidatus Bathyarchaeota archaeon]|nr:AAA family ATPase [Candidatus Bathyarchaeota archaeon]MCX8177066.1 AAA family ATPase [Candidatus Bathyarchaeota archaeon]MDW8194195.1 AAA family ATPase [Nitrososphaerota archaeon]
MNLLVIVGRGGTGKTSFVALTAKYFIEAGATPILLVDADPDQNLGEMVGVDLHAAGKKTISELLVETFLEEGGTTVGVPPTKRIESRIWSHGLYEGVDFDFIALGTKWIEGCYCLPNAALKGALESLTKNYRYVLIDSPAGLEHLNRRITSRVDDIFDVVDPSKKSFDHVERAYRIAVEVKISFKNFYVVGGFRFPEALEDQAKSLVRFKFLGKIAYDENVEKHVLAGESLLNLPINSPAYVSVKRIMNAAGHPC